MLSYVGRLWSPSKPVTRLEQFPETAKFMQVIQDLRAKTEELAAESIKAGASNLVKQKFAILAALVADLNKTIDVFNARTKPNYIEDLKEVVTVITLMAVDVDARLHGGDMLILVRQQDGSDYLKSTTEVMRDAGIAMAFPIFGGVEPSLTSYFVVNPAKRKLKQWWGVDPDKTASVLLLEQLRNELCTAGDELKRKLQIQLSTIDLTVEKVQSPSASSGVVRCSLTGNEVSDPVRCSLDDSIYEREALLDYLVQHGKSPVNEKPIPQNVPASAVMQEDEELKAFIAAQKQQRRSSMQPK